MLKPAHMSKVTVFGSRKEMPKIIDTLYSLGVYHIEEHRPDELDIGSPLPGSEEMASSLVTAKSILSHWKIKYTKEATQWPTPAQAVKKVDFLNSRHRALLEEKSQLIQEKEKLSRASETSIIMDRLGIDPDLLRSLKSVKGFVGTVRNLKGLKEAISKETSAFELKIEEIKGKTMVAVFAASDKAEQVQRILQSFGYAEIETGNMGDPKQLKKKISALESRINGLESDLSKLKNDNSDELVSAIAALEEAMEKNEAPLKFAVSENTFYITGFVPTANLEQLTKELEKTTSNKVEVFSVPVEKKEKIPIKLENPGPVRPYEFFLDLYSLPKYAEIDPTILTFITFPILFGFMLGDMGYGVITLAFFLIMKKFTPSLKRLLNILIFASIWTIVFGALFGEVFGEEVLFGYDLPRILSRLHQINDLLVLSVAVGVIHLNIGLLVGFYNEYKAHGLKAAIFEKVSWMLLQGSVALLALAYMQGTLPVWPGYALLAASIYMIYKGEGVKGLVELPGIFSNILSYARLMAIGLASAGLAIVVNQFAKDFFAMGLSGIVPAVLILVLGHTVNMALGILGPFLHSLRLHYVEFYTKFYKGGGKRFMPFGTGGR